jgi:putative spermidine/putrescine transport system permease protein
MAVTVAAGKPRPERRLATRILFLLAAVYFIVPMLAVLIVTLAGRWTANILPDSYTLDWWKASLGNPDLVGSFSTSLVLASGTAILDLLFVVPAAYWARVRNPRLRPIIELGAAIPFCLPYIVIAFGILQLSGIAVPALQGTFLLLMLGHTAIAFPFVYWAVDAAMAAAGVERLSEAAEACGASPVQILRSVILPNITPGLVTGSILAFATSFGEFAMAQVVGRGVRTVPIWSAEALRSYISAPGTFNQLAVITFVTFVLLFVLSAVIVYWNRNQNLRLLPGAAAVGEVGAAGDMP